MSPSMSWVCIIGQCFPASSDFQDWHSIQSCCLALGVFIYFWRHLRVNLKFSHATNIALSVPNEVSKHFPYWPLGSLQRVVSQSIGIIQSTASMVLTPFLELCILNTPDFILFPEDPSTLCSSILTMQAGLITKGLCNPFSKSRLILVSHLCPQ